MAILFTNLARILFAFPGYAFCSCIIVLIPKRLAAKTIGPETYPPNPTTASGLNLKSVKIDPMVPAKSLAKKFNMLKTFLDPSDVIGRAIKSMPFPEIISRSCFLRTTIRLLIRAR